MVEYVQANWVEITAIIGGIVTVASVVVKLTPTTKDDAVWAKFILPILNALALNPRVPKP